MKGMYKILNELERRELLKRHKAERDGRIKDRIKAVLLYDDGWTPPQIAKALFIDEKTIREHLKLYEEEQNLMLKHKGSAPKLSEEESKSLSEHLESTTYLKIKEIQAYVKHTFNKHMAVSTLHDWLKNHSFSYKKPKLMPKADPAQQKAFMEAYAKLMNEASLEGDPVLFGDSVHPSQQVRAAYGWIKRGKDKPIETTGARKRVNLMGVLNLETMRFGYQDFKRINGRAAIEFLRQVEKMYPHAKKIHLIWDQAGYHTSQEVKEFLKTSRIQVHYLPPRSPNLNPIERLWKIMHEYVSYNQIYEKFRHFKESLFHFFDNTLPTIKHLLISRITDNFQLLKPA
jgi:transposase